MNNIRIYGSAPYSTAVIHGGPGAAGDAAPVARELSGICGVLEPLQTKDTIDGQVKEMHDALISNGTGPFTLIGHSWGAFLSWIFAARYPGLVKKLILVSAPPFEDKYLPYYKMMRLSKLTEDEKEELRDIEFQLASNDTGSDTGIFKRFSELMSKSDTYDEIEHETDVIEIRADINKKVWGEAALLRKNGDILSMGSKIICHVTAVHGAEDPHPYEGVKNPLSKVLKDFRFILLERCGHYPWYEKFANKKFYKILFEELK